jgi:hypothetical protein
MRLYQASENVAQIYTEKPEQLTVAMSDLHWDNPHCRWDRLKRDLDKAVMMDAVIALGGDTFCLMQGRYDPRREDGNIRPEHAGGMYFDKIVDTAVEWFKPYAKHIVAIGYGNHETSIIKHNQTDIIARFIQGIKRETGHQIMTMGYGGWLVISLASSKNEYGSYHKSYRIKYFHGSGGGGEVTKGLIQHQRMQAATQGADCLWMGHVHEQYHVQVMLEALSQTGSMRVKQIEADWLRTSTYKDEFEDGSKGWHVERGGKAKPLGCALIRLELFRESHQKQRELKIKSEFTLWNK